MIPKPEPPDVTRSPEVVLSRARPLTGWAKSQKYLNVCLCTSSTNEESEMRGNLSVESIPVEKPAVEVAAMDPPPADCKPEETVRLYLVNGKRGEAGWSSKTLSLLW